MKEVKVLKKKLEMYKKQYYRLNSSSTIQSANRDLTPKSKVRKILKCRIIPADVKKRLFNGEVLASQLTSSMKEHQDDSSKQIFSKIIGCKILKKYRCLGLAEPLLTYKRFEANISRKFALIYERAKNATHGHFVSCVGKFLREEKQSRECLGKKDCITKKGLKKQKRYLNSSLTELYKVFLKESSIRMLGTMETMGYKNADLG